MLELRAAVLGALIQWSGGLYDPVHHIESAWLYGNIDSYSYYFVDLLVGTPPQRVSAILDTGSSLAAFPCKSCKRCGKHMDPNFDIAKSSTAKWLPCGKGCQGPCTEGHCTYHYGYREGSAISGYWFQDWVRLGDAKQRNPAVLATVGCHYKENKLFYTQKVNGILGIRGQWSLLDTLFKDKSHVKKQVFSICLAEWGGQLNVGGHNSSYHRGNIMWTGFVPTNYGVSLNSMKVAGRNKSINGFGDAIIDSGTTLTYMASHPYTALKKEIENYCKSHSGCGAKKNGNTCYVVQKGAAGLSKFPDVEVFLQGANAIWEPRGYLSRKGKSYEYCYTFGDDGPKARTVLGASWMLYKEVIFDLRANKVGIVKAECPEYKRRPKHSTEVLDHPTVPPPRGAPTLAHSPVPTPAPTPAPTSAPTMTAAHMPNQPSQVCVWQCYFDRYQDLQTVYGHDFDLLAEHWQKHGVAEGRDCTCQAQTTAASILPAVTPTAAAHTPAPDPPSKIFSWDTLTLPEDQEIGYARLVVSLLVLLTLCIFGSVARRRAFTARQARFNSNILPA